MLLFYIENKRYACACDDIIEVLPALILEPTMNRAVGMLQYRQGIVPVVDISQVLKNQPCARHFSTRILIMDDPLAKEIGRWVGVLVERATSILDVENSDFTPLNEPQEAAYLKGVYNDAEGQIQLVDLLGLLETVSANLGEQDGLQRREDESRST